MATNPLLAIKDCGQSIWLDNLSRDLLQSGELQRLIESYGLCGITSNPAIFHAAIAGNRLYDADIEAGAQNGKSVLEIYETLIFSDIHQACDLLRPIYEATQRRDGYVSVEVSPELARDTQGTIAEARRLFRELGRANVMLKIPGTPEGFPAIEEAIAEGINVNITLLFSVENYERAAWAYIRGLEARVKAGLPIDRVASVASFFLSRIDSKIDAELDEQLLRLGGGDPDRAARLRAYRGKVAIANAKVAYRKQKEILADPRWQVLVEQGANLQRLLWASTSTKNPAYSDVLYVNELIGAHTVNTLPLETLNACAEHCEVVADRLEMGVTEALHLIQSLKEPDSPINFEVVMEELLEEGIAKFVQPFRALLQSLEDKAIQLTPA